MAWWPAWITRTSAQTRVAAIRAVLSQPRDHVSQGRIGYVQRFAGVTEKVRPTNVALKVAEWKKRYVA